MRPAHVDTQDSPRNYPETPLAGSEPGVSFPSGRYLAQLLRTGARRVTHAYRRRRRLLLTPIAAMLPLSVAMALLLPSTYESSALLLLQETARNNPLASEPVSAEVIHQKLPGLEALLKSDQVLTRAAREMQAAGSSVTSGDLQNAIKDLRSALTMDLIGTDFLSVRLRGPRSEGLGRDLSIVLGSFLEALLAESTTSASQMVLSKQQKHIAALEQRSREVQEKISSRATAPDSNPAPTGTNAAYEELQRELRSLEQQTQGAREVYEDLSRRYPANGFSAGSGILNAAGRIKIVDPPKDPISPTSSRLKLILAGAAAGILLGIVLAWAAEIFDTTIYDTEDLVSAAGLPVLAVLSQPPAYAAAEGSAGEIRPAERSRAWIPVAVLAGAVVLALIYFGSSDAFQKRWHGWLGAISSQTLWNAKPPTRAMPAS